MSPGQWGVDQRRSNRAKAQLIRLSRGLLKARMRVKNLMSRLKNFGKEAY